jgi:hypothetical protein
VRGLQCARRIGGDFLGLGLAMAQHCATWRHPMEKERILTMNMILQDFSKDVVLFLHEVSHSNWKNQCVLKTVWWFQHASTYPKI